MVMLPDMECMNCSIRLVRQAAEWGTTCNNGAYDFYTCADVNIIKGKPGYSLCCRGSSCNCNNKVPIVTDSNI